MGMERDEELAYVVAQLRDGYQQLVAGGEYPWNRNQRLSFAAGLIAPQIRRLEALQAAVAVDPAVPAPAAQADPAREHTTPAPSVLCDDYGFAYEVER